ncbi:MAG: primosomal protein N' [Candidatus Moraniibacteriota bacterium]
MFDLLPTMNDGRVNIAFLITKGYTGAMKRDTIYFCDVAPVVPIPLGNRQAFSYLSEASIPRGSLVWIPFGPRTIKGVVLNCSEVARAERSSGRFKYIKSIIRESFLTDGQMTLAESVSKECLTPLGKTLRHFLPAIVKEREKKESAMPEKSKVWRLTEDEREAVATMIDPSDTKPFFLEADIEMSLRIVVGAKKSLGKKAQVLILVPEIISIPFAEQFLLERFGIERVATLHSALAEGAYFSAWERIRSGTADVILGTRQALFAPFGHLGLVAMLEEAETVGYKQWDMSPRYDARRVAMTLSELHGGATLLLAGSVQGLDTALRERLGEVRVLHIGDGAPMPLAPVSMIDMRKERWKKNYSLFSEDLRSIIAEARRSGKKVLLIANRGGLDSFSVCVSCKEVPRCPDCDRALRSTREGNFRCPACPYKTKSFPRCAKCGSLEFKNIGSGTEKIEREAARAFGSGSLVRIDETMFRKADKIKPYQSVLSAGILVGTPSVLNIGNLPDTAIIAIMDADNFLSFPDFQADERFLRMVARATFMAGPSGRVLIQAFRPEREALTHIADRSVASLLEKAARDREALRYPPYSRVFRIAFRDRTEKEAETLASEAHTRLTEAIGISKTIRVSPAMKPLISKVRGRYERIILVTGPRDKPFPEALEKILLSLPKAWTFDPDPLSLL